MILFSLVILHSGWEDAPLAREGREEARKAGLLLKAHGFEFDVVYTVSEETSFVTMLF